MAAEIKFPLVSIMDSSDSDDDQTYRRLFGFGNAATFPQHHNRSVARAPPRSSHHRTWRDPLADFKKKMDLWGDSDSDDDYILPGSSSAPAAPAAPALPSAPSAGADSASGSSAPDPTPPGDSAAAPPPPPSTAKDTRDAFTAEPVVAPKSKPEEDRKYPSPKAPKRPPAESEESAADSEYDTPDEGPPDAPPMTSVPDAPPMAPVLEKVAAKLEKKVMKLDLLSDIRKGGKLRTAANKEVIDLVNDLVNQVVANDELEQKHAKPTKHALYGAVMDAAKQPEKATMGSALAGIAAGKKKLRHVAPPKEGAEKELPPDEPTPLMQSVHARMAVINKAVNQGADDDWE